MAIDTRAKRAAAAHVKRAGKGVTPDATTPGIWRAAVAWNYGGNSFTPPTPGTAILDPTALGIESAMSVTTLNVPLGGAWSW